MDKQKAEILRALCEKHIHEVDKKDFDTFLYNALCENIFDEVVEVFTQINIHIPLKFTVLPHGFNVDNAKMPVYLKDAHFIAWLKKFDQMLEKIGLPKWERKDFKLNVTFSDELKTKTYGGLSISEVKSIIRAEWGINEELENILREIKNKDDYIHFLQDLVEILCRLRKPDDTRNPEKIYLYKSDLEFKYQILGEYNHDDRQITLYTKNIEAAAVENSNPDFREFEKVFAHELFHAYHYSNAKEKSYKTLYYPYTTTELSARKDYTAKIVKESLASAFEWFYCNELSINGCDKLSDSWRDNSLLYYPYSGARTLLHYAIMPSYKYTLHSKKFCDVFNKSLTDVDVAMRALLDDDEFYCVKNSLTVKEKFVKVPTLPTDLRGAFDEIMKNDSIGVIAQREITSIIRQNKNRLLIRDLLDVSYCEHTFGLTRYPVLSTTPMYDDLGHPRSYTDPVFRIGKTEYYLCKEWQERHRKPLLDWIWNNR